MRYGQRFDSVSVYRPLFNEDSSQKLVPAMEIGRNLRPDVWRRIDCSRNRVPLRNWTVHALFILSLAMVGCSKKSLDVGNEPDPIDDVAAATAAEAAAFCGACHVPPDPRTYPKDHWPVEVQRGLDFYEKYEHKEELPAPLDRLALVKYYMDAAPERLELPRPMTEVSTSSVLFTRSSLSSPQGKVKPGVAHIFLDGNELLVSDMTSGEVCKLGSSSSSPSLIAQVRAATHAERIDLKGNGSAGLLIADIGDPTPEDHLLGRLLYLEEDNGTPIEVVSDVGRLADFAVADFTGDGRQDIVLAEFGYHEVGGLHLLTQGNDSDSESRLSFRSGLIDERHGASHVFATDFDSDGDADLIVLHSQEFEEVAVYLNDGSGGFNRETVFSAPLPDYGCSCIDIGDIDGDGDVDVVLTNGDSMDSFLLKPHHSVQWLENVSEAKSEPTFVHHHVGTLVGAYGAALGDLDGDGDMDIAACAMTWDGSEINTVVWYEQQEENIFKAHALDLSDSQHACIEVGDFDQDGDMDIAVGEFDQFAELETWFSIWWNQGTSETETKVVHR